MKLKIQITFYRKESLFHEVIGTTTNITHYSLYLNSWNSLDKLIHQGIVEALD